MTDIRVMLCDCDDGWVEDYPPVPTPQGPRWSYARCTHCRNGEIDVPVYPIRQDELPPPRGLPL